MSPYEKTMNWSTEADTTVTSGHVPNPVQAAIARNQPPRQATRSSASTSSGSSSIPPNPVDVTIRQSQPQQHVEQVLMKDHHHHHVSAQNDEQTSPHHNPVQAAIERGNNPVQAAIERGNRTPSVNENVVDSAIKRGLHHSQTPVHAQSSDAAPAPISINVVGASPQNKDENVPRLCRLVKQSKSDEYGFNLHAEKQKGHFIGTVDSNSIAERAGLCFGQRIVGINGSQIYPTSRHPDVVELIRKHSDRVTLLVASVEVDKQYRQQSKSFSFNDCFDYDRGIILKPETRTEQQPDEVAEDEDEPPLPPPPPPVPEALGTVGPLASERDQRTGTTSSSASSADVKQQQQQQNPEPSSENSAPNRDTRAPSNGVVPVHQSPLPHQEFISTHTHNGDTQQQQDGPASPLDSNLSSQDSEVLDSPDAMFLGSAAEAAQRIKQRGARKRDPRLQQEMSLQEKHRIVTNM